MSERPEHADGWLDARTGWRRIVRSQLTGYLLPATVNRWYSLGFVLLIFVALQFLTGVLLLIYYVPDARFAFESVQSIANEIPFGWLIRLLHVHGASAMVVVMLLHMLSVVVMGSYKSPRELHWVTGCLLLFVALGLCFTGYVLPWSQLSFWATTVGMNLVGSVPGIGLAIQKAVQGGEVVGPATLGRTFALHIMVLPTAMLALIVTHLYLVRFSGISAPPRLRPVVEARKRHFFPDFVFEDLAVAFSVLAVFAAVLFFRPHLYFPPEAFEPADPFVTPEHVKPEWYFLAPYQVLRWIPNKTLGIALQILAVTAIVLLPFLDRGERVHILRRPLFLASLALVVVALVALTAVGMQ